MPQSGTLLVNQTKREDPRASVLGIWSRRGLVASGLVAHYRQRMAMLAKTSPPWLHGYMANVRHQVINSPNWLVLGDIPSRGKSR
jgi:hypothetical protein